MNWVLKHKGGCTDPIPFDDLYHEFPLRSKATKSTFKLGVKFKLEKVDRLEEYGLNDRVKLLYIFGQPMNEAFERMLRDEGATLELTDPGRLITYYRSADGSLQRGVPAQVNNGVKMEIDAEPVQNRELPALVEPKQEVEPPVPEAAEQLIPNSTDIVCTRLLYKLHSLTIVFSLPGLTKLSEKILKEKNEQRRGNRKISLERLSLLIHSCHQTLLDGASTDVPASDGTMIFVDFLRTYCQWLINLDVPETDGIVSEMIREIRLFDSAGDGPKKTHLFIFLFLAQTTAYSSSLYLLCHLSLSAHLRGILRNMTPSSIKLMNWILKNKKDFTGHIGLNLLFIESKLGYKNKKDTCLNGVNHKLKNIELLEEFGLNDRVKLLHMLLKPVTEEFERMLRDDGATLELTDSRLISYFRSADGTVERRIEPQQDVENEPIENENAPAAIGAPNLMEPKQEVEEQIDQPEAVTAQGLLEPKQESAGQTPAPSQVTQNRKRKTAGSSSVKVKQESIKLTIPATTLLNNLCNLASAFHWSNDFGITAQDETSGRSDQMILRTKIQKVIESSHEALMDGASFNIPASKDSIQLVDFLRVYRTWLLMTNYNNVQEIDDQMGQEIRDHDEREDGAPVKRIRVSKLLLILGLWLNVATPAI
ncbi:hypothetical protein CAEBREN_09556 [Caenorhabditis brenneri]|uniref:SPK domain-containing protein n=1 Tax=Caenorhabditis brenneri TaxID=135651 RepID=G0NIS6_CAEBE|nr:hypothetical protein CAEBREN_09556 [Caenorhabditis brenneri]